MKKNPCRRRSRRRKSLPPAFLRQSAADQRHPWRGALVFAGFLALLGLTWYFAGDRISGLILTVKDATGTLPGVINVTGNSAQLYSTGTQTLDNATVHLGGASGPGYLGSNSGTLTLGSNLHVLADGSASSYGYIVGDTIVNNGSIAFSNGNASNYIYPTTFTNNGAVSAANGSVVYIAPANFTNFSSGTLSGGSYQSYAGSVLNLPNDTDRGDIGRRCCAEWYGFHYSNLQDQRWHQPSDRRDVDNHQCERCAACVGES